MKRCISLNSKAFKDLAARSGLNAMELESRMSEWMNMNNTDNYPTLSQLNIEESNILESEVHPDEVANEVLDENNTYLVDDNSKYENYDINQDEELTQNSDEIWEPFVGELPENMVLVAGELGELSNKVDLTSLALKYKFQIKDLENENRALGESLKNLKGDDKKSILNKRAEIKLKIENLKDRFKTLNKIKNIKDIVAFGHEAIADVEATLSDPNMTPRKLNYAKRLINFWSQVGTFKYNRFGNPIFGNNTVSAEVADAFIAISIKMDRFTHSGWDADGNKKGTHQLQSEYIMSLVKKEIGDGYTESEIFAAIEDIGFFQKNVFALHDYGNPLLSTVYSAMERANSMGAKEFEEVNDGLKEAFKLADSALNATSKNGNKYDILFQEHNGQKTGDLVGIYSMNYNLKRKEMIEEAEATKSWKKFYDWSAKNEMHMDVRLLFPDARIKEEFKNNPEKLKQLADTHEKEFISLLGQRQFDKFVAFREDEVEDYNSARRAYEQFQMTTSMDASGRIQDMKRWERVNSPYFAMDRRNGVLKSDGTHGSNIVNWNGQIINEAKNVKGVRSIPREVDTDGNKTEWYDSKYKSIASNPELSKLYDHIFDIMDEMRHIMPSDKRRGINVNSLPNIKKSLMDSFSDSSAVGMTRLWEAIQKSFIVDSLPEVEYEETDINTKRKVKNLKVSTMMLTKDQLQHLVDLKTIKYKVETGNEATKEDLSRFKDEVFAEVNKDRSFDLPKILQVYIANLTAYKHKANIVDLVKLVKSTVEGEINELSVSSAGIVQKDSINKNPIKKIGLNNLMDVLDYQVSVWMGNKTHKDQGVSKNKTFTISEQSKVSDLIHQQTILDERFKKGEISQEYRDSTNKLLEDEINKTGGHLALSKAGDNLLKYVQLKGMGLNYIAGFVNVLTGWVENSIRAADGRSLSVEQLNRGYCISISAVLDPYQKLESTQKIVSMAKVFDIFHDASQELYEPNKFTKIAYILTTKTEFINVAAFASAYWKNIPVKDNLGNKSNLFEAFDKNGKVKDGWKLSDEKSNEDFIFDVKLKTDLLVMKSHGNYMDKMAGKEYWIGRAALQFRTWMPEMIATRWGKSEYDHILKQEFKGRWKSFKVLAGSENSKGDLFTSADNILHTLGQMAKQITFQKTSFNGRMSDVDAANMSANLMELHFVLGTMIMSLILASLFTPDDRKKYGINIAINLLQRQQADVIMFANPVQAEQLSKNLMPVLGVITDTQKVVWSIHQNLQGKGEYTNSVYKGMNKSTVASLKMMPIGSQLLRWNQYNAQDLNK